LTTTTEYGTIQLQKRKNKEKEMFIMTKKEMFALAIEYASTIDTDEARDVIEGLKHEIDLLSRKRSDNSKAKAESDARAEKVYNALAEMDRPVTISELLSLTSDVEVANYTNQRVSALMRKLGERVVKTMNKGKAYFTVA
jgi:ArsR family metal-binding transcriptional regulator